MSGHLRRPPRLRAQHARDTAGWPGARTGAEAEMVRSFKHLDGLGTG